MTRIINNTSITFGPDTHKPLFAMLLPIVE